MTSYGFPTRTRRTSASLLTGLLLAAAAVLMTGGPASAHDALIETDPAAGATLDALPAQITLAYSAAVLDEAGGNVVTVTDAAGTALTDGDPTVDQNIVTQSLTGQASGTITVTWRVVSSDGHPVSGEYTFVVAGTAGPTPTSSAVTPSATPTASPSASPSEEPVTATPLSAPADEGSGPWPWVAAVLVLVVVIVVVVWLLGARARQQRRAADALRAARGGAAAGEADRDQGDGDDGAADGKR